MRAGLRNGEFVPYLQPKIDCHTGKAVGAEALVRWIKPDGKVISPDFFISYFEKSGFITKIDMYMFGETCRILEKWIEEGREVFPCFLQFYISGHHRKQLHQIFEVNVRKAQVPPELLELELTESCALAIDLELQGKELSDHGFKLSIDDFGSGSTHLSLSCKYSR